MFYRQEKLNQGLVQAHSANTSGKKKTSSNRNYKIQNDSQEKSQDSQQDPLHQVKVKLLTGINQV